MHAYFKKFGKHKKEWRKNTEAFPGGPVVKTLSSLCRGHQFSSDPDQGTKILHSFKLGQKEKKKTENT